MTDEKLVSLLKRDPERGLRAALDAYLPLVRFILRGRLGGFGSDEDVADLTQEVFLALWEKREALDPARGTVKSFLCALARNKATDLLRRRVRENGEPLPGEDALPSEFSLEESLISAETKARLIEAVGALGSPDREIVLYRHFLGFSATETRKALGMTEGSVNVRLHRAHKKLREKLEEGEQ